MELKRNREAGLSEQKIAVFEKCAILKDILTFPVPRKLSLWAKAIHIKRISLFLP